MPEPMEAISLSPRAGRVSPSSTAAFSDLAARLRRQGRDVISLAAGEPDFDTPAAVVEAAHRALDAGRTRYAPVRGIPELRRAVRRKLARDNALTYEDEAVLVTSGAKQAVALAVEVLAGPGDEVIVPAPYWVSYPEMVRLAGARPVIAAVGADGYKLDADALARALSPHTRALILNSPCNPTGALYSAEELRAIADVCADSGITVISDEIYEKIVFDGRHHSIAASTPRLYARTVVINGCSKAYAMTGWRIGYAAGPPHVISAMAALASQRTTSACTFSQAAAAFALENEPPDVARMRAAYRRRRDLMAGALSDMGIACSLPPATFYLLADIRHLLPAAWSDTDIPDAHRFALELLEHAGVAVVPGDPFGAPGHLRLSFATSRDQIKIAMQRLAAFVRELRRDRRCAPDSGPAATP